MNKGFLSVTAMVIIGIVAFGGVIATHQMMVLDDENEKLTEQLREQKIENEEVDSPIEAVPDKCPNIDGEQEIVPDGYKHDSVTDNCVLIETVDSVKKEENIVYCNGQRLNDNCADSGRIFYCAPDVMECLEPDIFYTTQYCNGKSWRTNCGEGSTFVCPQTGEAYCSTQSPVLSESVDIVPELSNSNDNVLSELEAYLLKLEEERVAKKQAEQDMLNSRECKDAKKKLDNLNDKIDEYMDEEKYSKAADLSLEVKEVSDDMYQACYDYTPDSWGANLNYPSSYSSESYTTCSADQFGGFSCSGSSGITSCTSDQFGGISCDGPSGITTCTSDQFGGISCSSY